MIDVKLEMAEPLEWLCLLRKVELNKKRRARKPTEES